MTDEKQQVPFPLRGQGRGEQVFVSQQDGRTDVFDRVPHKSVQAPRGIPVDSRRTMIPVITAEKEAISN